MEDYQKMYYKMVQATESAINLLIAAQQECEELYVSAGIQGTEKEPDKAEPRA